VIYRYTEDIDLIKEYKYADADETMLRAANLTIGGPQGDASLEVDFRALGVDLLKVFLSTFPRI
jgi:hypothetical protein